MNKNLLVLAPDYPDKNNKMIGSLFVKEQVEYISKYFENVYVIAPVLKAFGMTMQSHYCEDYKVDNVSVFFPSCIFYPRVINLFPVSNYTKLYFDNRYSVIKKTIKNNNLEFDLIHSHMTFPATYAACKLKGEYPVPVIATIHEDSGWLREEMVMNHKKINYAWEKSDMLIRVNRTEIPLLKLYNKNVRFLPNGFTNSYTLLNKNDCRDILRINHDEKFIFAYGAMDERKGFQTLIESMLYHSKKHGDIRCYISGRGPYKPYLQKFIDRYNVGDTVKLLDFMSDKALCNWINAADLFIFPSLKESFGITQVNALACGCPVIASDNVGSCEIIKEKTGLLYSVGKALDLSAKISMGLDQTWDHKFIRDYAVSEYSWENISKQLIKLYEELI